ncbi:MAG: hypothetical protein ACREXS_05595 [Gammaproteobacteria bacterium]
MNYLKLKVSERVGLPNDKYVPLCEQYRELAKRRAKQTERLGPIHDTLGVLVFTLLVGSAVTDWLSSFPIWYLSVPVLALLLFARRHIMVVVQRNSYEKQLAELRVRELEKWLHERNITYGA